MTFWKRKNYGDSKLVNGFQGVVGGMNRQSTEAVKKILCDILMVSTCHHTFVQTIRCITLE